MTDQLQYLLLILMIAIPVMVFRWQIRRVRRGACGKLRGIALFVAYAFLPLLAYLGVFLALVGLEELTDRALIGEGFARGLIPILVMGIGEVLVLTVIFALVVSFVRSKRAASAD